MWWIMWVPHTRVYFARAEAPCGKGELQLGRLVIGWQKTLGVPQAADAVDPHAGSTAS